MNSSAFSPTSSRSGNLFDHYYNTVSPEAEVLNRTVRTNHLQGQAAFFNLVTRLNVPILDASGNQSGGQDHVLVGAGRSYGVSQAIFSLTGAHRSTIDFREKEPRELEALLSRRYVTKRIIPSPLRVANDAQQLAVITNEVRILSNETLKKADNIVKLLCVAWDEVPLEGRHWPRLLIEAADYGNLSEFMALSDDASQWKVKLGLVLDTLSGLKVLHNHEVAHCDLKMENVLVFRSDHPETDAETPRYQAKLCDFGFSVILSDYPEDASFCAQLGTEPWNAPELTFGTKITTKELPLADIYSFGLLFSRIYMNGRNPFEGLTQDEIHQLKRPDPRPDSDLVMYEWLHAKILSTTSYSEAQQHMIQLVLLSVLGQNPDSRFPIHVIAPQLVIMGTLFGDTENLSETAQKVTDDPGGSISRDESPRGENISFFALAKSLVKIFLTPVTLLAQGIKYGAFWILRTAFTKMGLINDPWEDLLKPKEVHVEPIERHSNFLTLLELIPQSDVTEDEFEKEKEALSQIPDFELSKHYNPIALSEGTMKELLQDLRDKATNPSESSSTLAAEATYQLAVAYFEGIGVIKDYKKGVEWLEKAAFMGSKKAIAAATNIFASVKKPLPAELQERIRVSLPDIAKSELHLSISQAFSNTIAASDQFTAVRQWMTQDPGAYGEYVKSSELGLFKVGGLAIVNIRDYRTHRDQNKEPFDFRVLEGYNAYDYAMFKRSDKDIFIRSVRSHKCLECTSLGGITLLHTAAARGDLELAKTLVIDLGANVDGTGTTEGLTPLWISCFFGNIEVAAFLESRGANVRCKDPSGRTILHFLNRCTTIEDLVELGKMVIRSGININERDTEGNTPLLSTFIGWDFTQRLAAHLCLVLKADVLVLTKNLWTPLTAAARSLDSVLFQELSNGLERSLLHSSSTLQAPDFSIEESKFQAYNALCMQNEFHHRRVGGAETFENLFQIVDLIVDKGMMDNFKASDVGNGTNPLIGACFMRQDHVVNAVLRAKNCPGLDEVEKNGLSALHWATQRGRFEPAMKLLSAGANPLLPDNSSRNAFHHSAQFSPKLLEHILGEIEAGRIRSPTNLDVKLILDIETQSHETVFTLLVTEGSAVHLEVAEALRRRYGIDHDTCTISLPHKDTKVTLMGFLIANAVVSNLFTLQQIEYVLNLEPRPRFVVDISGATLLHYAVDTFQHESMGSNPTGYAILGVLLRSFPGREYLDQPDSGGDSPMHVATWNSNITAIEIIHEHLTSMGQTLDPNVPNHEGITPLDGVGQVLENLKLEEDEHRSMFRGLRRRTARTYAYMRNLGAHFSWERGGIMICLFARVQNELSKGRLLRFLEMTRRALDLPWEFIKADIKTAAEGTEEASFVIELCWCFDHFVLQARPIMTNEVTAYISKRYEHRLKKTDMGTSYPWIKNKYEESIFGHQVHWTRPGRLWTVEERRELTTRVTTAWNLLFPAGSTTVRIQDPAVEPKD